MFQFSRLSRRRSLITLHNEFQIMTGKTLNTFSNICQWLHLYGYPTWPLKRHGGPWFRLHPKIGKEKDLMWLLC